MENKKKTILVTGGAGFIGSNLIKFLLEEGHTVSVLDDLSAGKREYVPDNVAFHKGDVRDIELMKKASENADVIIHLAAVPRVQDSIDDPVRTHDTNVNGTLSVLETARQNNIKRVVLASTSAIYGDSETLPLHENLNTAPKSPYALHKLVGEEYLKLCSLLYGVETVSLRLFNVYGPNFDPEGPYALVVGKFLESIKKDQPLIITGDGKQTRDFVHVGDVARAFTLAAVSDAVGRGEIINIGSGVETSVGELAAMLSDKFEYIEPRIEPRKIYADVGLAEKLLGWKPEIDLHTGIENLKRELN